jgi:hypothetical protein
MQIISSMAFKKLRIYDWKKRGPKSSEQFCFPKDKSTGAKECNYLLKRFTLNEYRVTKISPPAIATSG